MTCFSQNIVLYKDTEYQWKILWLWSIHFLLLVNLFCCIKDRDKAAYDAKLEEQETIYLHSNLLSEQFIHV